MVCNEHIQGIETISIVVACAYAQTLLIDIVIPCSSTTINAISISYKIFKAVDTISSQHFVALSKYSEANLTFLWAIEFATISIIDISRFAEFCCTSTISECAILYRLSNRISKMCLMQSLTKDAVTLQTLKGIAKQT